MYKRKILTVIGLICLFLAIISGAVLVTINFRPLYLFDIEHLGINDYTGYSKPVLAENFSALMRYLNHPFAHHLSMPDFPVSDSGAFHFMEVKRLFWLDYILFFVTIIPAVQYLRFLIKTKQLWQLKDKFKLAAVVPPVVALTMAMGFDTFFYQFHQLFFNNDAWIFDPATDPVINALPAEFFMHCFIFFFVLIEGAFLIFYLMGKKALRIN